MVSAVSFFFVLFHYFFWIKSIENNIFMEKKERDGAGQRAVAIDDGARFVFSWLLIVLASMEASPLGWCFVTVTTTTTTTTTATTTTTTTTTRTTKKNETKRRRGLRKWQRGPPLTNSEELVAVEWMNDNSIKPARSRRWKKKQKKKTNQPKHNRWPGTGCYPTRLPWTFRGDQW